MATAKPVRHKTLGRVRDWMAEDERDAENRLVSVTIAATGHRSEFGYDGLGRRVCIRELDPDQTQTLQVTSDNKYIWDGVEIAEKRDVTGGIVLQRYYSQGFVDSDGTPLYYTRDHLGSIRELTDGTQAVRARYDYDPYGRMTKVGSGDRDSSFGYTGHFWHGPSGLDLTFYRAYDPNHGRWISRDPIEETGGVNLYDYVGNEPIDSIYTTGLKVYGNWCGGDWTGGHVEEYTPHPVGYYAPPIDGLDNACMQHDICYYKCRKDNPNCPSGRANCFKNNCDPVLADAASKWGGFYGNIIAAAMNRPWARDPGPNGIPGGGH